MDARFAIPNLESRLLTHVNREQQHLPEHMSRVSDVLQVTGTSDAPQRQSSREFRNCSQNVSADSTKTHLDVAAKRRSIFRTWSGEDPGHPHRAPRPMQSEAKPGRVQSSGAQAATSYSLEQRRQFLWRGRATYPQAETTSGHFCPRQPAKGAHAETKNTPWPSTNGWKIKRSAAASSGRSEDGVAADCNDQGINQENVGTDEREKKDKTSEDNPKSKTPTKCAGGKLEDKPLKDSPKCQNVAAKPRLQRGEYTGSLSESGQRLASTEGQMACKNPRPRTIYTES